MPNCLCVLVHCKCDPFAFISWYLLYTPLRKFLVESTDCYNAMPQGRLDRRCLENEMLPETSRIKPSQFWCSFRNEVMETPFLLSAPWNPGRYSLDQGHCFRAALGIGNSRHNILRVPIAFSSGTRASFAGGFGFVTFNSSDPRSVSVIARLFADQWYTDLHVKHPVLVFGPHVLRFR